jgi:hypothetical protein
MKVYSIHDKEFKKYGQVIACPYLDLFEKESRAIVIPETGCSYMASVPAFETAETLAYYRAYFGDMDTQIGYCWGRNDTLNALEWHRSSEVHCALEDMMLLLGDMREMENGVFDSKNIKAFLVKKGESVEIYQTTLHFCPSMPNNKVFKNVVILPRGTNTPLTHTSDDKKLVARNKWLICHGDSKKHVDMGRVVGIIGENIVVK